MSALTPQPFDADAVAVPTVAVHPLIVCGGSGTRLWPISRRQSPKQFQRVAGPDGPTFFQSAVRRHAGPFWADPIVVTGLLHEGTVRQQLREVQTRARLICEPMGRNTGPAVLAACHAALVTDPDAVMVVVPADHVIAGDLTAAMAACVAGARAGRIVTFGIPPRHAESGFGYIVDAGPLPEAPPLRRVDRFVEKPPVDEAQALIDGGGAYWASGLSMFAASNLVAEYERHDPATAALVAEAVAEAEVRDDALHLAGRHFGEADARPTEAAVFERTDRIALMPLALEWDDVGSWKAMHGVAGPDAAGNVLQGDVIAVGTRNVMVRAESRLVGIVGLDDVVVVETPDALLVARMDATQDVKAVVDRLKADRRPEAERPAGASPAMVALPTLPEDIAGDLASRDGGSFRLGTAEVAVGRAVEMPPAPAHHLAICVRGRLLVTGAGWSKQVGQGGRIYGDPDASVSLRNLSDEPAELLFVTPGHG